MAEQYTYEVWLSQVDGIGARRFGDLVRYFGSAQDVFEQANANSLASAGINADTARKLLDDKNTAKLDSLLNELDKSGIEAIVQESEQYPYMLKQQFDAPPVIYKKGSYDLSMLDRAIGVVGTRRCSSYGKRTAHSLSRDLALKSVAVISGMARGIDSCAHKGALEGGGVTIAVLGCGADIVYPPENQTLYEEIQQSGAVLSEYFPGTPVHAGNFPARNRLISGLAHGVMVVESAKRGGSLITTEFALEQGRDVFAVPGNINSLVSEGCNRLIREGASPVTCVEDIMSDMGWDAQGTKQSAEALELDFQETSVYNLLLEGEMQYDNLASKAGMDNGDLLTCLTMMELRGIIKQLPGRVFSIR